jgi:hypothetical protein
MPLPFCFLIILFGLILSFLKVAICRAIALSGVTLLMLYRGADTFKEYEERLVKIVEALVALDASVIGLIEIENDGFGPQSSVNRCLEYSLW